VSQRSSGRPTEVSNRRLESFSIRCVHCPPCSRSGRSSRSRGLVWQGGGASAPRPTHHGRLVRWCEGVGHRRRIRASATQSGLALEDSRAGREKLFNGKSREAPSHPWEMGLDGGFGYLPTSEVRVETLLELIFYPRLLNRNLTGDAFIGVSFDRACIHQP
jgi:hypothetical protein